MKIIEVKSLTIPDIKVIKFARFLDDRGYFTEHFRKSDILNHKELSSMKNFQFVQANQSFSKKGVVRGLHFQWDPYMGKLVRTILGHMIDLVLDIRKGSPTFGKIIGYDMPASTTSDYEEWIWVPPGFAHGNIFLEDTIIEYFCTGEYNQKCEAGISPLSKDLDWSLCQSEIKKLFDETIGEAVLSEKDKNAFSFNQWINDERSDNFIYETLTKYEIVKENEILFTGGSGLLGKEMKKIMPNMLYPSHQEFDVTDYKKMEDYIRDKSIKIIIHAAAFTSPPLIDKDPIKACETNIIGTANVVKLCSKNNIKIVYISTDYVFKGDKGNYSEEDSVYPVNKYGWSKLGGECAVRLYDNHLIIRTSFGPKIFPYEAAFIDQWTSREQVGIIAEKIKKAIIADLKGTLHIGGERKTVFEYAKNLDPSKQIKKLSIQEVNFKVPKDTSLNCSKYNKIFYGKIR
jgi:dTDP-4-dehydrorhamnose 3,5-epimerase